MSVPPLIQAVQDRLSADAALDGVLVRFGLLAKLPTERERIYLLGTADFRREAISGGHRVRQQRFDVRALAEVHHTDRDPTRAMTRLWELIDIVDQSLLQDPDLLHAEYDGTLRVIGDETNPASDGWIARAAFRLAMHGTQ